MALKTCKECGSQVSTKANECPNCGAPIRKGRVGCLGAVVIIIFVLIIIGFVSSLFEQKEKKKQTTERPKKATELVEERKDKVRLIAEKRKQDFLDTIEQHYQKLASLHREGKIDQASKELRLFESYQKLDYKNVRDIKDAMRIATIKELEDEVRGIPVARADDNLRIYKQLLNLDPENPKYKKKVAFYEAKINEERLKRQREKILCNPSNGLQILKFSWSTGSSDVIAEWKVLIQNLSSTCAFKDIKFKTRYYGASGTKIDESVLGHTEYIILKPKSKKWITFTEFTHSQARSANIEIAKAEKAY